MEIDKKVSILKDMGKSYEQIGARLGVSKQRAEQIHHRDEYNARQRHSDHKYTATAYKNRQPCPLCEAKPQTSATLPD